MIFDTLLFPLYKPIWYEFTDRRGMREYVRVKEEINTGDVNG